LQLKKEEPSVAIDTTNDCGVGLSGGNIILLNPKSRLTGDEALRLAAWIVTLIDGTTDHEGFDIVLNAIEGT
jgi:hypothetical protein